MRNIQWQKIETSSIYILTALLILSIFSLTLKAKAGSAEKFPNLYANSTGDMRVVTDKTVFLTFDDGPSRNTELILDILAEYDVKATFFVCGQEAVGVDSKAILMRIVSEGHEIGLHSFSHDYSDIYKSLGAYLKDLDCINNYVFDVTGFKPSIVRLPGGSGTCHASKDLVSTILTEIERRGYRSYDWDVDTQDAVMSKQSPQKMASRVVAGAKNRDRVIVLMHDANAQKNTPEAVRLIIEAMADKGYGFDKLTAEVDNKKHYS